MSAFPEALQAQADKIILPTELRSDLLSTLPAEIKRRAMFSSCVTYENLLQQIDDGIEDILNGLATEAQVRSKLMRLEAFTCDAELSKNGRVMLVLNTNTDMARGFGQFKQGMSKTRPERLSRAGTFSGGDSQGTAQLAAALGGLRRTVLSRRIRLSAGAHDCAQDRPDLGVHFGLRE